MTVSERHVRPAPVVDRPLMPDGYLSDNKLKGFVPWSHVEERMAAALNYWICVTRANGRPHASPIWGMWLDDTLYFDGSPETARGRAIAANPDIVVHLESGDDVVIMDGSAYELKSPSLDLRTRLAAAYTAKYQSSDYAPEPDTWEHGGLYIFQIHKVLAWTSFTDDPTRFTFST